MSNEPLTPGQQRNNERVKLTVPAALGAIIDMHQARNAIPKRSEAILSLVRAGAKAEGLLGGQKQ